MTPEGLIYLVVAVVVACIIAVALVWLVRTAPMIPAEWKPMLTWAVWAIAVVILLIWLVNATGIAGKRLW